MISLPCLAKKRPRKKPVDPYESMNFADATQRFIANQWIGLNYNMDKFFSNQTYKITTNKSMIMAYYGFFKKEGLKPEYNYDLKIKVHLPNTTKKMRITFEKERDDIFESNNSIAGNMQSRTSSTKAGGAVGKSTYAAGLTYLFSENAYFQTFLDSGLKIILPLDPFLKLRFQKSIETQAVNIFASQKFIEYRQDGFSEITQLSFFKKMNKWFQTELINTLSWNDASDTFIHRNNLLLYQLIDDKKSMSYSAGANAKLSPTFYYDSYDVSVNYRQLIHNNWLFAYLSIGADFPKEKDFQAQKFVQFRLEVFFR